MNRIEELEAEVARLRERVADLGEALDMLAIATRKYRSLPRIDGDTIGRLEAELSEALEKARAVLRGDAPTTPAIREEVRWFAVEMERKLRQNDWRGGWADSHPDWLLDRLREETRELDAAVQAGRPNKIIDEAADVANFAMMIADQQRKILEDHGILGDAPKED